MATSTTTVEDDITALQLGEMVEIDPNTGLALKWEETSTKEEKVNDKRSTDETQKQNKVNCKMGTKAAEEEPENEKVQQVEVPVDVEVEPKTGVSFPVKLDDVKHLRAVGLRKKSLFGIGLKIYAFGIYTDNEKLKHHLRANIERAPAKPTKEMYQLVIDSDVGMMVRLVIVSSNLTMNMVRKNFDEGVGASIKKLTGGKNAELTKRIMGEASFDIKLTTGSIIEISFIPGYILQTKVKGQVMSKIESKLLCRACVHMYLGDDPFDKEAKERFGMSMLSLFQ